MRTFQCQTNEPKFLYSILPVFDQFQPPQYSDVHQPPEEISIEELKTMMQSYCEIMSQRREQEAILLQEQSSSERTRITRKYTIPETESDELIKSSVENLVPTLSESEDLSDIENELAHIEFNSTRNYEADFDPEEEIRLVEKLLYDNSSPRPPEEFNSENSDAVIESFSPSPIPVEGSDSLMEEIDIFLAPDDSMPPGIENDDYDSEGDILFLEELLSNDSPSLHENESFHFDVPSSPRPPAKPSDDGIYFEPDTGVFTKVVDDISDNSTRELYIHVPNVLPTLPTLSPMFDTLLPFSSKNDDKVFNPRILASNEEKSPHLLSHRGFKAFQVISDFSKSPMMIYGEDIPILDVPIAPDYEASRARGFVLRSLELQSLA
ncbi:hypothetical protein Tco_0397648 [Tanacetum coccineum]